MNSDLENQLTREPTSGGFDMDRPRPEALLIKITRRAVIALIALTLVAGAVAIARIDFTTRSVDRSQPGMGTIQQGTMQISVAATKTALEPSSTGERK